MWTAYQQIHKIKEEMGEEIKLHLLYPLYLSKFENLNQFVSSNDKYNLFPFLPDEIRILREGNVTSSDVEYTYVLFTSCLIVHKQEKLQNAVPDKKVNTHFGINSYAI